MAAFTSTKNLLTKENIHKHLDTYQLFKAYCKNFGSIDEMFKSEFRRDVEPSCHIIVWDGDLLYKDFGERGYRVFDYIARKFNTDLIGALKIINKDFNLGLGRSDDFIRTGTSTEIIIPEKSSFNINQFEQRPTIIEVTPRRWTQADRKYLAQYDIPPLLLKYHKIYSIENYRIDSKRQDNISYRVAPDQIAFTMEYYWVDGVFRRKLYFPQAKGKGRFVSNVDNTIVQGWTLLPKNGSEILFVTKSYKDILIFNLLGYWAIAPNSEHSSIPDKVMEKLKLRFRNIYVWFDNDESGKAGAESFGKRFDLPFTFNPDEEPKDPSDFVKKYTLKDFDKLVTQFLKNSERNYSSNF